MTTAKGNEKKMNHSDFCAAHAALMTDLTEKRDAELARAAEIKAAAGSAYATATRNAEDEHLREHNSRVEAFQRYAAEAYAAPVRAYVADPSRANVAALGAVLNMIEAEAWNAVGLSLDRSNRGAGHELLHALMQATIEKTPSAAERLSVESNLNIGGAATHYNRAVTALRAGDVVGAQVSLFALEAAIGQIAREGSRCGGDSAARWEIVRFGGTLAKREAALAAHDAAAHELASGMTAAERQIRSSAMQEATTRTDLGESVERAYHRIVGEMKARVGKALEAIAPTPATRNQPAVNDRDDDDAKPPRVVSFI